MKNEPFQEGFGEFFRSGLFSDITIIANDKLTSKSLSFKCHKTILSRASEWLDSEIQRQGNSNTLQLQTSNIGYFKELLDFVYNGRIILNSANSIPLLELASEFEVIDLKLAALNYIIGIITPQNVLVVLNQTKEYSVEAEIISKCIQVVCKNFSQITENGPDQFNFAPAQIMARIFSQNSLSTPNEILVYDVVRAYCKANHEHLSPEDKALVWGCVRVPFLSDDILKQAEEEGFMPASLLIEAYRLKKSSQPQSDAGPHQHFPKVDLSVLRKTRRAVYAINLEYHEGTTSPHGVFHFIGTTDDTPSNKQTAPAATRRAVRDFRNPAEEPNKAASVVTSSEAKGKVTTILELAASKPSDFWTENVPASWVQVGLDGRRSLVLTHYTLRHGSATSNSDSLRNWSLQGSNNAHDWCLLKKHQNDTTLNAAGAVATWAIQPLVPTPFKYFRILQTGHNSSGRNFLSLSNLELYGELYESFEENLGYKTFAK